MSNAYSMEDLLDFLAQASDRGLMPAATATALSVASRNVLGMLPEDEKRDVRALDIDSVIKRFQNKRARDFSPGTLKEYGRRLQRAISLFTDWRDDPANFSVKTRTTTISAPKNRKKKGSGSGRPEDLTPNGEEVAPPPARQVPASEGGGYQSAFPVRPGRVVILDNLPSDLTKAEAERLAQFIMMLAIE